MPKMKKETAQKAGEAVLGSAVQEGQGILTTAAGLDHRQDGEPEQAAVSSLEKTAEKAAGYTAEALSKAVQVHGRKKATAPQREPIASSASPKRPTERNIPVSPENEAVQEKQEQPLEEKPETLSTLDSWNPAESSGSEDAPFSPPVQTLHSRPVSAEPLKTAPSALQLQERPDILVLNANELETLSFEETEAAPTLTAPTLRAYQPFIEEDPVPLPGKTGSTSGFEASSLPASQTDRRFVSESSTRTNRPQNRAGTPKPNAEQQEDRSPLHVKKTEEPSLKIGDEQPLQTYESDGAAYKLQLKSENLSTFSESESALRTFGETAGQGGASAAVGAGTAGVSVAVQAGVKLSEKIKETIQTSIRQVKESPTAFSALAVLLFIPVLLLAMAASIISNSASASNRDLSQNVIDLMPLITQACQANNIPEYVPLVAAVVMQESGGDVDLVHGDVMMCAEAMGYPVFTPVPVEESINFGTGLIASLLHRVNSHGPDDIVAISLALQAYNYGPGYIDWVTANHGRRYTKENALAFSEYMAAQMGWSGYGDPEYVDHVLRYYQLDFFGSLFGDSMIEDGFFAYPYPEHGWDTYNGHEGIDIAWDGCYGEPVYAVADGVVSYTHDGWTPSEGFSGIRSYGNTVWVSHQNGWNSRYGHLSALAVTEGEQVVQGQLLGYIGDTGNITAAHLHLSLYSPSGPFNGSQNWAELAWPQHKD